MSKVATWDDWALLPGWYITAGGTLVSGERILQQEESIVIMDAPHSFIISRQHAV